MTHLEHCKGRFRNVAALVVSCDNYSDIWPIFFSLYRKFWPDNPLEKTYLLTNFLEPYYEGVEIIGVGEDVSWSDNLAAALLRIEEEYILLLLEDLLLTDYVNAKSFEELLNWSLERSVNYMRFNPSTPPDKIIAPNVGVASEGAVYRASVVAALWKKDVLLALLKSGENAWEFETHGSIRSDAYPDFYSAVRNTFPIINSIVKRVWERSALRKLRRLGVKVDLSSRPVASLGGEIIWKLKLLRSKIFSLVPHRLRRTVKRFFRRGDYYSGGSAHEQKKKTVV